MVHIGAGGDTAIGAATDILTLGSTIHGTMEVFMTHGITAATTDITAGTAHITAIISITDGTTHTTTIMDMAQVI